MRTTTFFFLAVGLLLFRPAWGQAPVQQKIDADVWRPFIRAYGNLDIEAFLAVHASDAIRVVRDNESIRAGENYHEEIRKSVATYQQRGGRRTIDLRFTQRFAQGDLAFDSGYYKVVVTYDQGESYSFFGQFEVILKKFGDRWKIFVDSDYSHGGTVTEDDFLKGKPVGEY